MPQPPASQPAQFSTPNASKFRLPKRPDGKSATPLATPGSGLPSTARPAPRFTPSWRRHSFLPQSQAQAQSPVAPVSGIYTPRPISSHARQFSSVGRSHGHTSKGAPALFTEESIEDGSSPPRADDDLEPAPQPIETENGYGVDNDIEITSTEESLRVARNSPTMVRALTEHPRHMQHVLHSQRRRPDPQEEIEDVPGSEDGREARGANLPSNSDIDVVEDSGEVAVPDSLTSDTAAGLAATTPGLLREDTGQPKSVLPQQRSATRLLSSVQPFKRRRLFVPSGMITSSPGEGEEEDAGHDVERKQPKRRPWDIDIDDDDESDDQNNYMEYEEIQDIVKYGELLEYGDSDDEMNNDEEHHENEEDENEDDYSMFDRTPTRVRRARQEELEKAQSISNPRPQPAFRRARLFMSARKMVESGIEDLNHENENDDLMQVDTPSHNTSSTKLADYALPAPDFFSPQKKKKRNTKAKSKRQSLNDDGTDSAAAPIQSAATTAEQYVPGGLAAELRDWLVQIKNGSGMAAAMAKTRTKKGKPSILGAYQVEDVSEPSSGMRLAVARQPPNTSTSMSTSTDEDLDTRLLLAGEDKSAGTRRAGTRQAEPPQSSLSTVSVAAPAWEVVLDGQSWVVASNWSGG